MTAATQAVRIADDAQDHYERTRLRHMLKPTRETQRKLRPDILARLLASKHITAGQARSGIEIRTVYSYVAAGLLARSGWPTDRLARSPSDCSTPAVLIDYRDHYLPWAQFLARHRPMLEITIDLVVDEWTANAIDRARHWRHGTAQEMLVNALALYARNAGY